MMLILTPLRTNALNFGKKPPTGRGFSSPFIINDSWNNVLLVAFYPTSSTLFHIFELALSQHDCVIENSQLSG